MERHMAPGHRNLLSEDRPCGDGVVRILTLHRPAQRNALDSALLGEHGLVNRVVPRDQLIDAATAVAAEWGKVDRGTIAATKRLFCRTLELPFEAAVQTGVDVTAATWTPRR